MVSTPGNGLRFRSLVMCFGNLGNYFRFKPLRFSYRFVWFVRSLMKLSADRNPALGEISLYPCLEDRTSSTPLDPTYFYQDAWAARKLFELRPEHHHDVGSSAMTIGLLAQFVPTTMVDIRPIELTLDNLSFIEGSVLDLPFEDCSVESLSSLCVVEHVGLGRYGDELDPSGTEKAIAELKRVVKPGGSLMISVPVDGENRLYFNAHRALTRDYILGLLDGFDVVEERYQYGDSLFEEYDPARGFGTGLYLLRKHDV